MKDSLLSLKKLIIALAGPFINLLFIILFIILKQKSILIYINIIILIFNLLPIYPLDGGRILKYFLAIFCGRRKAYSITYVISNIVAILATFSILLLSIYVKNFSYIFILVYIWIILIKENKKYKIKKNIYKILENNIAINQD